MTNFRSKRGFQSSRVTRLLSALLASSALLAPVGAGAETLADALAAAYANNPSLQAERARLRAIDEQVPQALSNWRPTLTAEGSYGTVETETTLTSIAGKTKNNLDPLTGSVVLNQNIFRGGRTVNSTRQADATVFAARENLRNAEQQTLLDAVTAYMDVMRDLAIVDLRRKNVEVLERQLQAAQDRFDVGEITRTDVAQSEARLQRSQANLIRAEAVLTASRAAYARVVGNAPGSLEFPKGVPALPAGEDQALEVALQLSPVLSAAEYNEQASRHAVSVAKGALLPTVSVSASFEHAEDPTTITRRSETSALIGRVTVPLYESGAVYSQVRQAKQTASQNRLLILDARRRVEEAISVAWEQLRATRSAIQANQQQVKANEIALEGVRQEAQVGSRTTLDVLDAEQELLDARVTLVGAQRDEIVASYGLLAAVGKMTARDLQLAVDYYDPAANYEDVRGKWIGYGINDE